MRTVQGFETRKFSSKWNWLQNLGFYRISVLTLYLVNYDWWCCVTFRLGSNLHNFNNRLINPYVEHFQRHYVTLKKNIIIYRRRSPGPIIAASSSSSLCTISRLPTNQIIVRLLIRFYSILCQFSVHYPRIFIKEPFQLLEINSLLIPISILSLLPLFFVLQLSW